MSGILNAFFGGNYGAKPDAPTVGTATATGTTTATLTFSAPAFDGGVTITSYTATSSPGGITSTLNQSGGGTFNITGLSPGTAYTFSVTATNAIGTSASSGASNSITTYSVPANTVAPVVSGTAQFGQTLSTTNGTWTGVPSPSFSYQWQRAGSNIGGATGSTYQLVSADVGNAIRCVVTATNVAGSSSANSNATSAVVAAVPGAPQSVGAYATGATTATVYWSAPASDGGAAITSYSIYWSGGSTSTGSTSVGIGGLTALTSYTFTVYAINSAGTGPGTASNSITTTVTPGQTVYTGNSGIGSNVSYCWYPPSGVTSASAVAVGMGGTGTGGSGGGGGALAYVNNFSVSSSSPVSIFIPGYYACYCSTTISSAGAQRGRNVVNGVVTGGTGGAGGRAGQCGNPYGISSGGGGAGGYSGAGGRGAAPYYNPAPTNGSGGGGGGGSGSGQANYFGGGGGGVGLLGQGASGAAGAYVGLGSSCLPPGGGGGSGGADGVAGHAGNAPGYSSGGSYGGGGGSAPYYTSETYGGPGAVRIIWPGSTRSFPSTCTGNL